MIDSLCPTFDTSLQFVTEKLISFVKYRAVFKQLSKNQNQSNYSDQSQQEQTALNQSQFLAIICNSLKAREKSRVRGATGFGFTPHWLKNCRESF